MSIFPGGTRSEYTKIDNGAASGTDGSADSPLVVSESVLLEALPSPDETTLRRIEKREAGVITVEFGFAETPFGECLIATREQLICHLTFHDPGDPGERGSALEILGQYWPRLATTPNDQLAQALANDLFSPTSATPGLVLAGTQFQHEVWRTLQQIPSGRLTTYGAIARAIGAPTASRAVGAAVGANRIAWLIPCHRVIRASGVLTGYRWGSARKAAMLGWEAARRL